MRQTSAIGFICELYLWRYHWDVDQTTDLARYREACLIRKFETAVPDA